MLEKGLETNNISNFNLKLSYWYVSHKLQIRKLLVVFLILTSVVFYSYSIYRAVMIFAIEDRDWQSSLSVLTTELIDYQYFRVTQKPQDLQVLSFNATNAVEGRFDFIAKARNPNPNFVVLNATFELISGNRVVAQKDAFIYPDEDKYIIFFGMEGVPQNLVLRISNISWQRFHEFENYATSRLAFEVSDVEFKSAVDSGIKGELPISTLNFKIRNKTPFSYWQVGAYMVLLNPNKAVGANYISLEQFKSGEIREVEMRWYEPLPSITQVEILPEIEILNLDSYIQAR